MKRLLPNRAEKLTAVIAVWAIVLAPLAAVANCCCVASAPTAQATDPALATGDRLDPVSCCATESTDVGTSESTATPACCTPAASSKSLADSAAQSCACQTTCCDTNVSQAVAVVSTPSQQVHPLDWDALPVALLDEMPWVTRSNWSEAAREPVYLSAQARCAKLCRWLN